VGNACDFSHLWSSCLCGSHNHGVSSPSTMSGSSGGTPHCHCGEIAVLRVARIMKNHYQKNRNYRWQKSVGNDKSLWLIKNYPRITDDYKSVCNSGIGKFWWIFGPWVIHTEHSPWVITHHPNSVGNTYDHLPWIISHNLAFVGNAHKSLSMGNFPL